MTNKFKALFTLTAFSALLFSGLNAGPNSPAVNEKKIEEITKKVYPTVVKVEARNRTKKVATGVIIDKDGYIVTTALISPRDEKITVVTSEGKRIDAKFLGMDLETNLALIQTIEKNLPAIAMGKVSDLFPGSWIGVVSISPENTPAITQGIVSSVSEDKLRLNVWVVPGSSGSPVVDEEGQMVGLLRGIYAEDQPVVFEFKEREAVASGYVFSRAQAPASGMAVAIPVNIVRSVTSEIKEKGKVRRGWLGVLIADNEEGKVEITAVDKESPAELAKLKEGDIVLKIDGKDVTGSQMLASEIRKRKPGEDITLKIEREGKELDVKVKLGEYPEEEARKELELRFPRLFPRLPEPPKVVVPETPRVVPPAPPKAPKPGLRDWWRWEYRKYIGVYLEETSKELSEYFGLKEGRGLLVSRIEKGGPAEKAGLKVGDVIFKADGKRVETVDDLAALIQDKKKADKVKIEFLRDKKAMSVEVEVEEEERGDLFSPKNWEEYLDTWQEYTDAFREQWGKWQQDYGQEYKEKMKRLNEEISKKYKDFTEETKKAAKQWSSSFKKNWFRI